MRTRKLTLMRGTAALATSVLALAANQALAAEYWLKAAPTTVDMPDPNGGPAISVAMWGYASCAGAFAPPCTAVTIPGPALTVAAGDTTLTVHLLNGLTVPTSLVINGLFKSMTPVWDTGDLGPRPTLAARVRSFDTEAAPSNGAQADYTWSDVKPGTYLYQSGTQPQVQVQMGMYGALTKNATDASGVTRARAYPGTAYEYDNQATLLYSEIDPALHAAVAGGNYGCPPADPGCGNTTSTFNYEPKYFLINGQPFRSGASALEPVGTQGGVTLLRLLNAGLTTHVPAIQGMYWDVVAEDGKPYPYRLSQYTALLTAAKTMDTMLTPDIGSTYAIMDRRLSLSNNGAPNGGMMALMSFGPIASMPGGGGGGGGGGLGFSAVDDAYDSVRGVTLNVATASGVLANDPISGTTVIKAVAANGSTTGGGTFSLNTNGSFTYTSAPGYAGVTDSFQYRVTDGKALSPMATVTITLTVPTAPALALLDNFNRVDSTAGLGADWSQTASTGSSPNIQLNANQASAAASDLGGQAIWKQEYLETQGAAMKLGPLPGNSALLLKATGGTLTAAPTNCVRVRYEAGSGEIVISTMVGSSDASVFVKQASFAAAASSGTLSAVVNAKGLVTVFQNGAYVGGAQLPDVGAWKGKGRIGIQIQTDGAVIDDFSGGSL